MYARHIIRPTIPSQSKRVLGINKTSIYCAFFLLIFSVATVFDIKHKIMINSSQNAMINNIRNKQYLCYICRNSQWSCWTFAFSNTMYRLDKIESEPCGFCCLLSNERVDLGCIWSSQLSISSIRCNYRNCQTSNKKRGNIMTWFQIYAPCNPVIKRMVDYDIISIEAGQLNESYLSPCSSSLSKLLSVKLHQKTLVSGFRDPGV